MRNKRFAAGIVVLGVLLLVGLAARFAPFWESGAPGADAASPAQTFYLEGTIYDLVECDCILLDSGSSTYELYGDLEGLTCGDRVGVWVHSCPPEECGGDIFICGAGTPVIVEDIVTLPEPTPTPEPTPAEPVGGIAEVPGVAEGGSSSRSYIALAAVAAAALSGLAAGAWYARGRWLR